MFPEHFKRIGLLSKTHGIHGTLVLRMGRYFNEDIDEREFLFVSVDDTMIPFSIEDIRMKGDDAFVKFAEISSEKEAILIKGRPVFIPSKEIDDHVNDPELLTGFILTDETSGNRAVITDYHDQPDNPLFSAEIGDREYLIPVHQEFIISVDFKEKSIHMRLPEGIFELEE